MKWKGDDMGSLKRWRKVGSGGGAGSFIKWVDIGQSLEGVWQGQHDGKFGPLGTIKTKDGEKIFPLHTGLLNQVEEIAEGTEVKIEYLGLKNNKKSGRDFKDFAVYTAEVDEDGPIVDAVVEEEGFIEDPEETG